MLLQEIRAFPGSEIHVSSSAVLHGRLPAKPPGLQRDQRGNLGICRTLFLSVEGVFLLLISVISND